MKKTSFKEIEVIAKLAEKMFGQINDERLKRPLDYSEKRFEFSIDENRTGVVETRRDDITLHIFKNQDVEMKFPNINAKCLRI